MHLDTEYRLAIERSMCSFYTGKKGLDDDFTWGSIKPSPAIPGGPLM